MRKTAKKLLATGLAAVLALTGMTALPNSSSTSQAAEGYSVYFACQTNGSWVFRNNCHDSTYGLGSEAFEGGLYDTEDVKWVKNADGQWETLASNPKAAGTVPAVITDAHNITLTDEEQTITVKCEADPVVGKLDFGDTGETHGEDAINPVAFNTVYISTTIPEEEVEVTGCKLTLDGTVVNVHDGKDLYFLGMDDMGCLQVDILNAWNTELVANETYTMPTQSIVIELTVKAKAVVETPAPTDTPEEPTVEPSDEPTAAPVEAPVAVKGVTAKNTKAKTAVVSWKKVSDADGYVVYRATKKNGKYIAVKTINKAATVKFTNKKLKKGSTYYFKVKAFVQDDSEQVLSEKFSNIAKVKIKK